MPLNQAHRWRFGAIAGAVALVASVVTLPAYALSLGRISVLSALGEPLRAEIDVAQITPEEASSLKAGVATPEAFKAAGLEYTPVLAGMEVTLQRRADGRSYLRLTSSRPVSEPFVDLVLQATWSAGRLTRDYTMLFDPPGSRANATAVAPTAPILSRPAAPPPASARTPAPAIASESASITPPATREARPTPPATASRPEPRVRPAAPRVASAENTGAADKQLTVKPGDTAGKIAAQNKPGTVSLDQMLVAILRSNPNAFIGGNINRIKSGAVLAMPDADAAGAVPAGEASQTIIAQSKDFNNFRRKLAEGVATTTVDSADRKAGGKVQAKVEDRAPATATPDKLTLSKGSVQAKSAAAEDAIVKNRQASEASSRVAELSKNISDLNKLGVGPGAASAPPATASPAAAASAAKVPGVAVPTPSVVVAPPAPVAAPTTPAVAASQPASATNAATVTAPAVTQAASATASAAAVPASTSPSAAASASSAAADSTAARPAVVVPPQAPAPATPAPESSFLDDLLKNDLVLPLGAALLALLAGLGIYTYRKRKSGAPVDSSFLESRLQPDSFFGASGGQRIDTNEVSASGSSLVYSPSQLDAAGDVDPVAEADVYLAYGRDLQAEEILKEALRTTPGRVAIHAKLAEIYAKRRDNKAFQSVAQEAFNLTKGEGPEWAYVSEMGRELDALNPLYKAAGLPADDKVATNAVTATSGAPSAAAASAAGVAAAGVAGAGLSAFSSAPAASPKPAVDVDLDLDFPLGGMQDGHTSPAPIAALSTPEPIRAPVFDKLDMDFSDISSKPIALTYPVPISRESIAQPNAGVFAKAAPAATAAPAAALPDSGMLEFDLDSLSLDITGPNSLSPPVSTTSANANEEDPLTTKFQLAEEFRSLGDADGARSLAEEVLTEARGPLKVKAQAFLNSLI